MYEDPIEGLASISFYSFGERSRKEHKSRGVDENGRDSVPARIRWTLRFNGKSASHFVRSFFTHCQGGLMKRNVGGFRSNAKLARQLWGEPSRIALRSLRELTY